MSTAGQRGAAEDTSRLKRTTVFCLLVLTLSSVLACPANVPGADALLKVPLIDGHNDLPWNLRLIEKNKLRNVDFNKDLTGDSKWNCTSCFTDIPRLRAGRVGAQFWAAYVSCDSQYKDAVEQTIEQIDVIKRLADAYPDDLQFVDSVQGIWDAFNAGKIGSLIGVEGGHSIDSRLGVLRSMYELGVRYMTLTHSCNTPWADSSPEDEKENPQFNGLTPYGELVVKELNRLGMMVDLSHVSAPTMRAAIEISEAPVIFSHSSARAICGHHRNVPDDVLKLVAANNGVVMVNFYSGFIVCEDRDATLEDVVAHINHIRNVAGVDHVGIGSDYDGVEEMPTGLEDVSKYPDLFNRLAEAREGEPTWTQEDLQKLAGLNLLRVFKEVENVRDKQAKEGIQPQEEWLPEEDIPEEQKACLTKAT
ncbi:dipeptidase 1 isoform X2 [Anabrus simplex]|uniref:dipeptidase 1 isoform X2 n=1 Tax=Anabrus simplex TaxID=316456 RepID=UPI0035A33053